LSPSSSSQRKRVAARKTALTFFRTDEKEEALSSTSNLREDHPPLLSLKGEEEKEGEDAPNGS